MIELKWNSKNVRGRSWGALDPPVRDGREATLRNGLACRGGREVSEPHTTSMRLPQGAIALRRSNRRRERPQTGVVEINALMVNDESAHTLLMRSGGDG